MCGISVGIGIIAAAIRADPIRHLQRRLHVQQYHPPDRRLGSLLIPAHHPLRVCVFIGITAGTHTLAVEEGTTVETLHRRGTVRRRLHRAVRRTRSRQRVPPKLQLLLHCRLKCVGTGIIAGITTHATIPR